MTGYTLLHIATILVFILLVVALAALIDWIFGTWKKPLLPPVKRKVTWCDTHGHVLRLAEENHVYRCAICSLRIVRDELDLTPLEAFDAELSDLRPLLDEIGWPVE